MAFVTDFLVLGTTVIVLLAFGVICFRRIEA
jgi:hypothetical protein